MVVHPDHHWNENNRVVEEVQLDAWQPQLENAGGHGTAEQVMANRRLNDQQQVFDVMPELDAQRDRPPSAILHARESRTEEPQSNQHHERVAVVQHFGFHEPRVVKPEQAQRLRHRPAEHVDLECLKEMLAPVCKHDCRERAQRELVMLTVQTVDEGRLTRTHAVSVSRVHVPSSIEGDSLPAAILQMHYFAVYPELPAARDRFIVDLRRPRPQHDPSRYQNLTVEDELTERGDVARVGTVFLTGRECAWRCAMCDLWQSTTKGDTPRGAIPAQLAAARQLWREAREPITRVKLYNASNFFDPRAVPEADYPAIALELGDIDRVIVESHPSLIGPRVERFTSVLAGPSLEVAMGLETAHPAALDALNKRMTTDDFVRAAQWLRDRGVPIRAFVLIYPPFIPVEQQDEWLIRSVALAASCGASVVSLIPTRGGNGAMEALAREGLFQAPTREDVARSVTVALSSLRPSALRPRIFLDPWAANAS